MAKMALSSSQLLNIALGLVIVVGGFSAYKYGNFDGVSFDELSEKYISKTDVKFSDLPQEVQKNYIDKDATIEQNKDAAPLLEDEYLDEQGRVIPESEVTKQDMKRLIGKLQKTLLFLQHDNLLITNEKNELAKKLEEQENEREEEKAQLLSKNTERLNEAEQQHYRNISDLTMKINELQKENVVIAQKANIEANTLRSQIEDLKSQAIDAEKQKQLDIQKAREEEQGKLVDYKEKIKLLNDQISLLNEQITTNTDTAKSAFMRKQEEIDKLKAQIDQAAKEKNDLMSTQTQTLLSIEQKHKDEIAKYVKTIEQLKLDTEKLIAKNRQEMIDQDQEHLKKTALQDEKIKALNSELASAQKHIDALMLENEKDFNKFKTYLEDEKKLNQELSATNKKLEENAQSMEKSLNAALLKQKEELAKKEIAIQELNDKITKLNNDKITIEAEVKRRVDENDKVHNKNYKIFNEKIASFEASKKNLIDNLDKQLNEYKATAKETYDRMQFHTDELTRTNDDLKQKMSAKEQELQGLKNQMLALKLDHQKAQESQDAALKETRNAFEVLRGDTKQKEQAYLAKIQTLEAELKTKETLVNTAKKEEALKIAALEKEIKTKALEMQAIKDENSRHAGALKTMQLKLKDAEDNATKATNKQIEELKAKLAQTEKNRAIENSQLVDLKDTLRAKEIEYLDALRAKDKELKTKETHLGNAKEEFKKLTLAKQESDEQLKKLKDELKQKELQNLEAAKTYQTQLKAKETQNTADKKEESLKIIALEKEITQQKAKIASSNDAYQKLQTQKSALDEKLAQLKEEQKKSELAHLEATKALQSELKAKESALNGTQKQETIKNIALEKELKQKETAFNQEKEALAKRLAASEQNVKTLNEKLTLLESTSAKAAPKVATNAAKPSKGTKPVLVDSIMCTDMGTGVNAVSQPCKQAVQTFLAKYDSSYFFEVAPIVDNGGFASLKLIKSKKVGVEDSEIDRITGLANIGLGKARAKAGGDLIEHYVGEGAKISYALSNIEKDKARGFQIKVYQ
jgi:hypothetical protein